MTTLAFPGDTPFVFITGKHWRQGDEIVGMFEKEELEICMLIAGVWTEDRDLRQGGLYDGTGER